MKILRYTKKYHEIYKGWNKAMGDPGGKYL